MPVQTSPAQVPSGPDLSVATRALAKSQGEVCPLEQCRALETSSAAGEEGGAPAALMYRAALAQPLQMLVPLQMVILVS